MTTRRVGIAGGALFVAVGAVVGSWSCAATPPNTPIRSFEGAQKAAVVCLAVNDSAGNTLLTPPVAVTQDQCTPVATGVTGSLLPNHLFTLVTQTVRGELAVVDLTSGVVVDEDRSTPGTNFIPVGPNPTDVVVSPDATHSFVSSASRVPGIYGIDNTRILGSASFVTNANGTVSTATPLLLTSLTACSLSQAPLALAVVPVTSAADAGTDAGTPSASSYDVVALLGSSLASAKVVTIDPVRSGLVGGVPGAMPPCVVSGSVVLSSALPPTFQVGPAWPDGVPYADAGTTVGGGEPSLGPSCPASPGSSPSGDAGTDAEVVDEAGASPDAAEAEGGAGIPFPPAIPVAPSPRNMVMRNDSPILYVADDTVPVIHVIDLSVPSSPTELEPLLATSAGQPDDQVRVGALAISPPTRDYKVYLYAVDAGNGTLMVYDVTDPALSPHQPLTRPHPELNPFSPVDRLAFSSPVTTVAFAQHDWPIPPAAITGQGVGDNFHTYTGLLCNPGPNAHPNSSTFNDFGAWYRVDQTGQIQATGTALNFPYRLRGIFGFATLSNGTVITIDVDDWDAPCRRPDPMAVGNLTGELDVPQPAATSTSDLDPYHVPLAYSSDPSLAEAAAVTLEPFFPVSAPHRMRSSVLLRNDPTAGNNAPNILNAPTLVDVNGSPVSAAGQNGLSPTIQSTTLPPGFVDPTQNETPVEPNPANVRYAPVVGLLGDANDLPPPGIRLSFDDPTASQNQDWSVTYEGVLPSAQSVEADIASVIPAGSPGAYGQLSFSVNGPNLCSLGIEDATIGAARATTALQAMGALGLPANQTLPTWTGDYLEITDDIPVQNDPYWSVALPPTTPPADAADETAVDNCWAGTGFDDASSRFNICAQTFGAPSEDGGVGANPDTFYERDLPIVAAYSDHLVVGRFGWPNGVTEQTNNRVVVANDPVNGPPRLKLVTCCFHRQAGFKVRAGGEWVAGGLGGIGMLHHVVTDPVTNACKLSCDPNDALLNARSFDVPYGTVDTSCHPPDNKTPVVDRNSPLAMRNPMFSYVTWSGCGAITAPMMAQGVHTLTARDLSWRFSVRGGFSPQTIALNEGTAAEVKPQSMLFVNAIGQLAIVDGAQQGLILIDLNTLAFSHAPFF